MNKLRFFLLLLAITLCLPAAAQAHVLITDDSGTLGAILHITPDDDPIAGEASSIYFDLQGQAFSKHTHQITLQITDDKQHTADVPASLSGNAISATYVFPRQGVYKLSLAAQAQPEPGVSAHAHTFTYSQRVARGVAGSPLDEPTHAWADMGLAIAVSGLVLLAIIGINRREDIAKYSQWHH